jgi:hypothetical protein
MLVEGDYRGAVLIAEESASPLGRCKVLAEIYYHAGSPLEALRHARSGLAIDETDPELLLRASAASIWLKDIEAARGYLGHLEVNEGTRSQPEVSLYRAECTRIEEGQRAMERAIVQAQAMSFSLLALAIGLLFFGVGFQGRSSKPVS